MFREPMTIAEWKILPPCRLNFEGATLDEISAAAIEPDPDDLEGEILERLGARDTVIAAALTNDGF
jgi:hypothetical protein